MDPATINAIRQQAGAAPLTNGAPTVSAWDSIQQKLNAAPPAEPISQTLTNVAKGALKVATDPIGAGIQYAESTAPKIVQGAKNIATDFNKRIDTTATIENSSENLPAKVLDIGGQGAGLINNAIGEAAKAVLPTSLSKLISAETKPAIEAAAASPVGQSIIKWWEQLPTETQQHLGATGQIGLLLSNALGLGAGKGAIDTAGTIAKDALAPIKDVAVSSFDAVKNAQPLAKLRGVADVKIQDGINKEVDGLLTATRGINNKVQLAGQKGADLKATLSDPTVFKGIQVKNGKIVPDEAITTIEDRIEKVMDAKHEMLPEIDRLVPEVPRETIRQRAVADITGQFPPADEAALIERINKQVDALPETMKPSEIDALRAKFRTAARDAKGIQKSSSEYAALENAARDTVFDITDKLPVSGAEEYKALNDYVKNMITTKDFLDKTLRNQVVKGGRLGGYSLKLIGAIAGTSHGPIGAIIGSEVGGAISDIIVNNQLGSSIKLRLIKNMTDDPEIIAQAEQLLKDVKDLNVPQLPPASSGFRSIKSDTAPIQLPARTQTTIDAADTARRSPKVEEGAPKNAKDSIKEFFTMKNGEFVENPTGLIPLGDGISASRRRIKHIVEERIADGYDEVKIEKMFERVPTVLKEPEFTIPNPNQKTPGSFISGKIFHGETEGLLVIHKPDGEIIDVINSYYRRGGDYSKISK